jgi:hypothetical protein
MIERFSVRMVLFAALITAVPVAIATTDRSEKADAPQLIQPGERLVLLGVTGDNHALVQEGSTVYATELKRGARKHFVATTPLCVYLRRSCVRVDQS